MTPAWKRHLRDVVLLFSVGVLSTLLYCSNCFARFHDTWDDFLLSGLMWIALWKGNAWIAEYPDRFLSWKAHPARRLLVGITLHVVYTLVATIFLYQLVSFMEDGSFRLPDWRLLVGFNLPAVIVTLIISLFLTARSFLFSWRNLAIEHEQLKAESMASRFASLKAQVNPHFLFNSLNVLSGLVYQDADLSARFIKKLSEIYRYVLEQQDQELVPIREELEFVDSVVFLQRIRFGEHLKVQVNISREAPYLVAPLALQMLLENAIKHNVIAEERPLEISLDVRGDYLLVSNNFQPKTILEDSPGVGLENIRNRYALLSPKPVEVRQENGKFVVKLPIIEAL